MRNNTNQHYNHNRRAHTVVAMPRISMYSSRGEWEAACWQKLLQSKERLNYIVTLYERRNIIMRAAVAHRLHERVSYRDIGRELWLSSQTISVIKKRLRREAISELCGPRRNGAQEKSVQR